MNHADWGDASRAVTRAGDAALADAERHIEELGFTPTTELRDLSGHGSSAAAALSRAARAWDATLAAVATHPGGQGGHWACQFDPEEVVALAPAPVLYVSGNSLESGLAEPSRVLVAVDGGEAATRAL